MKAGRSFPGQPQDYGKATHMKFPGALMMIAAAFAAPAAAQNWNLGTPVAIVATDSGFAPATVTLRAGRQYVLTIRNRTGRKTSFSAPSFFKYARVAPKDSGWVVKNVVELAPGQTARLHIVAPDTPNAAYAFRSTRLADAGRDMKGEILVR